jgi:hypothetical protein
MLNHTFLTVNGLQFSKSLAGKIVKVGQLPDFPDEVTIQQGEVLHQAPWTVKNRSRAVFLKNPVTRWFSIVKARSYCATVGQI